MRCQAENREDAALDSLLSPAANAALQAHLAAAAAAAAAPASMVWSPCLLLHTVLGSAALVLLLSWGAWPSPGCMSQSCCKSI